MGRVRRTQLVHLRNPRLLIACMVTGPGCDVGFSCNGMYTIREKGLRNSIVPFPSPKNERT